MTDPTGFCSLIGDDYCYPDYGITISNKFTSSERILIRRVLTRFASLLGGIAAFQRNIALNHIEKAWPCADNFCSSRMIADNAAYKPATRSLELSPNLLTAAIDMDPQHHDPYFVIDCPLDIFGPHLFPDIPRSTFPDQESVFQFVMTHEMTHALIHANRTVFDSFVAAFWPQQTCHAWLFSYACTPGPAPDPSITRNQNRSAFPDWRAEVLADVLAGYLFAPSLLGTKYDAWIEQSLRTVLH